MSEIRRNIFLGVSILVAAFAVAAVPLRGGAQFGLLNPKKIALGLAAKQLAPTVVDSTPIKLDWFDLYPTVAEPPGGPFRPALDLKTRRKQYDAAIARLKQDPTGTMHLAPGDYVFSGVVYCTHGGVQRFGPELARWHEQFALGPLRGPRAPILQALYARASVAHLAWEPVQQLSWAITGGLTYEELPSAQRALFDRMVPEYRSKMASSPLEAIQERWRAVQRRIPGLPSLDAAVDSMGPVGQTVKQLEIERNVAISNARDFDAEKRALAPAAAPSPGATLPPHAWSIVAPGVYERMQTPDDYRGIGSRVAIEVRILAPAAVPESSPVSSMMTRLLSRMGLIAEASSWDGGGFNGGGSLGYPPCVSCQPLGWGLGPPPGAGPPPPPSRGAPPGPDR